MGRWEALAKIVEIFVASGRPGYGLAALTITAVTTLLAAVLLVVASSGAAPHWLNRAPTTAPVQIPRR